MEKAYDLKELVSKLKARGLDLAEDTAKGVLDDVLSWTSESAAVSANKVDDFAGVVIPMIKPYILQQLDKIDGQVGA